MHSIASTAPSLQSSFAGVLPTAISPPRRAAPLALSRILGNALLLVALLTLNMGGNAGAGIFFAILAVMLVVSPEAAFKSLAICYLGLMINSFFVPKSLVWTPSRLVIPLLALVRFSLDFAACRLSLLNRASYGSLVLFSAVMAFCSIASGWYTQIALLKIAYFLCFVTTVFTATAVLRHRRADLGEWFVSAILATALFGFAAIAFRVHGNFRSTNVNAYEFIAGNGFNGAFNHPNAHAIYASMFVAYLAIVWVLSPYRQRWLVLPLMACWAVFIVWSASRTAVAASAAVIPLLMLYAKPLQTRFGWRLRPHLRRRTMVAIGAAALIAALFYDAATNRSLSNVISSYVVKGTVSEADDRQRFSVERILSSRKALVEFSWQNFLDNPFTGIGFGVAKTEYFQRRATYFTAPAEKGFLPTAILEEGGLVGTAAFLLFLGLFTRELMRERNVAGLVMFLVFITTNLGEVTIFSPGGAGAFGWIMVGAAMVLGDRCWKPPAINVSPQIETRGRRP